MKKIRKCILPVLFTGTLIISGLAVFLCPAETYSENEKRVLSELPDMTFENIFSGNYGKELEAYLCDHIPGRDMFVGINSYFSYLLGRNPTEDIYKGKDGYLINAPKDDVAQNFVINMNSIENFSKKQNIESTMMIIPTSGYIMEDKLSPFAKKYDDDELFNKAVNLIPSVDFLDVRLALYNAYREGKQVYYRTDHHLTSEGSYNAYREFCRFRSLACPEKEHYNIESFDGFMGTTYSGSGFWLTDSECVEIWDIGINPEVSFEKNSDKIYDTLFFKEHLLKKDMYPVYLDGNHPYVKIHNPDSSNGNLLIIRDSFAQNMAPFMSYNYKNIYMLDMRYYRGSMDEFVKENSIDEILYLFGIDTLKTDSSLSWLMF